MNATPTGDGRVNLAPTGERAHTMRSYNKYGQTTSFLADDGLISACWIYPKQLRIASANLIGS